MINTERKVMKNIDEQFEKFLRDITVEDIEASKVNRDMPKIIWNTAYHAGAESQAEVIKTLKEDLKVCLTFIDNNIDYDDQTDEVLSRLAKKHGLDV
jgi:hypothetical protein